ncbi:hypothetical protein CsSME_00026546 [Camellia sinensis var. sinensis]
MMESIATASKLFCCIVFVPLVLNCFNDFRSDAKLLPREEVKALETISARLQIKHFTVNQSFCSSGTFQINGTDGSETTVICNCNSTVCHVTNMYELVFLLNFTYSRLARCMAMQIENEK